MFRPFFVSLKKHLKVKNYKDIPIFIISFNRLEMLKLLIKDLENKGYTNIQILDNKSTYPPLLEYYKNLKHKIHYLDKNYGHMAFWKCGQFDDIIKNQYYAITDSDILPVEECPDDFMELFYNILKKNPKFTKVGFSLKIDDIPDYNIQKDFITKWESQFYEIYCDYIYKDKNLKIYDADIDTTFALYGPNKNFIKRNFYSAIRTGFPYQSKHLPWYKNQVNKVEEDIYYINHVKKGESNYSVDITSGELFNKYIFHNIEVKKFNNNLSHKFDWVEPVFSIKKKCSANKLFLVINFLGLKISIKERVKY